MTDGADRITSLIATHRATALRARAAEDLATAFAREAHAYQAMARAALAQLVEVTRRADALEREARRLRHDLARLTAAATSPQAA